nr:integrase, catalytic region, zinc finger, CCHC-type, peptidase aspartic, catalytic [Tanacetum cinerariifolium]
MGLSFRMSKVDIIEDTRTMHDVQAQLVMGELRTELGMLIQVKQGGQDNVVDDDVDEQPIQDLALNMDNVLQADDYDAFDYDVDEALTAQTMFMANLSSADPVYDEAGPSYDSDVLTEAQTTEIKEMKTISDELEAEVDQNALNRKCDEIERKNLLIANDTLIDNCLSKEVFYIATNSKLNVSRFSKMHEAHTVIQARCLELETELSKLKDKI